MTYYPEASPIVDGAWLEERLDNTAVKVIEVCSDADDNIYRSGHIPGAIRFFWKDLCWHESDRQFVTPAELASSRQASCPPVYSLSCRSKGTF